MSVSGVGMDLLDIDRMESNLENGHFMDRVFTESEREYIRSRGRFSASSAAGIFCAKEAFMKAVGEGLAIPLRDIEVCRDERGKPFICLYGKTALRFRPLKIDLSITHSNTTAGAVVVVSESEDSDANKNCGQ